MAFTINNISGMADNMLSETSKTIRAESRKTEFIKYDKLMPSALNKDFSKNGIDELAEQIFSDGLDQPLVVSLANNGKYEIIAGERRFLAIGKLIDSDRWNEDRLVECKVKNYEESSLPLSKKDKKILTWLTTNQYREKTDSDLYIETLRWSEIIKKLRKAGTNILVTGYDEEGNPIEKPIEGKTRNIVAEQASISPAQVGKIDYIEAHGTDALKKALKSDKINISSAAKVAALPRDEQDDFVSEIEKNTSISKKDVDVASQGSAENAVLTKKELKSDLTELRDVLKTFEDKSMDKKSYRSYRNHIRALLNLLK